MAVTTQNSTQYARTVATPPTHNSTHEWHGRVRSMFFEHTQSGAGDAGSIVRAVRLPAGSVRLILPLSRIAFSAFGAARTLDIGWEAYTDDNGDAVAADPNGLDDGVDVSSAGSINPGGTVGTHETYLFQSQDGVVITLQTNDGTIPDAATLDGYLIYVQD